MEKNIKMGKNKSNSGFLQGSKVFVYKSTATTLQVFKMYKMSCKTSTSISYKFVNLL